jgi:hypothetical protein
MATPTAPSPAVAYLRGLEASLGPEGWALYLALEHAVLGDRERKQVLATIGAAADLGEAQTAVEATKWIESRFGSLQSTTGCPDGIVKLYGLPASDPIYAPGHLVWTWLWDRVACPASKSLEANILSDADLAWGGPPENGSSPASGASGRGRT